MVASLINLIQTWTDSIFPQNAATCNALAPFLSFNDKTWFIINDGPRLLLLLLLLSFFFFFLLLLSLAASPPPLSFFMTNIKIVFSISCPFRSEQMWKRERPALLAFRNCCCSNSLLDISSPPASVSCWRRIYSSNDRWLFPTIIWSGVVPWSFDAVMAVSNDRWLVVIQNTSSFKYWTMAVFPCEQVANSAESPWLFGCCRIRSLTKSSCLSNFCRTCRNNDTFP